MSARAPAGKVNRKIGSVTATWISETVKGSALRSVISQREAVSNIAVPRLAASLASHRIVNAP